MRKDIGFIGLGKMGSVMAPLFIEAGHKLTVYNRSVEKTEPLRRMDALVEKLLQRFQKILILFLPC
ncbi:MAG: hypothetical protein Ct9H300mP6_00030 [Gammaproteobacteria bacterium]|nr:MAG: hypothetical protein Ct9H300mP6_00030 [Gammaproteobacteria bacterium]